MTTTLKFGLIVIPFALIYTPIMLEMGLEWYSDPNYSHGFLIPVISGYFLWVHRKALKSLRTDPIWFGYVVIIIGLALYIVGAMGDEMFTRRASLLLVLAGIVLVLGGKEWFAGVRFPLFYLAFMIPLPYFLYNEMAVPLKLFAAKIATAILHLFSYPILREGNILYLGDVTFEVADACSGMRSILSIIALAVAMAWMFHKALWEKLTLVFASVPIAIAVNVIRIVITGMLSYWYGSEVAEGFFHEFAGLLIFGAALIMLFGTSSLLSKFDARDEK
ncbi:MAG: exosortase/archaeosortase family protein [Deltaproteobacteria bacterium]|nr:exosortase/archaeosortase family protein [Deltaproteobacteria bacterium]